MHTRKTEYLVIKICRFYTEGEGGCTRNFLHEKILLPSARHLEERPTVSQSVR